MKFEKGKAKPLSQQEKVILSLKKVSPGYRTDCSTWAREIIIKTLDSTPTESGERVLSTGTCMFHLRRTGDGTILQPKRMGFRLVCVDTKDEWGLPDVKVVEHNFSEI